MEWIQAAIDLGFPVAVALYLLIFQSKQNDRSIKMQMEVKIGLYLILNEMQLIDKYEQRLKEARLDEASKKGET